MELINCRALWKGAGSSAHQAWIADNRRAHACLKLPDHATIFDVANTRRGIFYGNAFILRCIRKTFSRNNKIRHFGG